MGSLLLCRWRSTSTKIIGLLRETKNRWECRVPLTPENVKELKREWGDQLEFQVQPSRKRIFQDDEYIKAGASLNNDLKECDLLMGVKEVPLDQLLPNKSYIFFSHTHKGQKRNIPLLNRICSNGITLYDYELITKEEKRLVAFGRFAGYAGMINALNGLGDVLLSRGIRTPFIHVPLAHHYRNLDHVKRSMIELGNEIKTKEISKEVNPIIFTFTGNGNVSQGAQEIFKLLPHEWIEAKDLKETIKLDLKRDRVYGCLVGAKDYIKPKFDNEIFDYQKYLSNPELFESQFHETIAPFSTSIINGIYWEPKYPRLITKEQMKKIQSNDQNRLLTIADISCDIEGSIEFMNKASTIDEPFYYYDAINDFYTPKAKSSSCGVQIMSIDNLPTELPEDSSKYFGNQLLSLIPSLAGLKTDEIIEKSKITENGEIVQKFDHLKKLLKKEKTILILGSGYVVPPVVDYFEKVNRESSDTMIKIIIGTNTPEEAKDQFKNVEVVGLDVTKDKETLNSLIEKSDIVISLVTASLHIPIAESCIKNKKNMVTASYISPEMESLDSAAIAADILILNEIGLDPGLDHLAAMKVIEECKEKGEVIESFVSWCGGLPAPESATSNPFRYKFSWSPRGVLLAAQNPAKYLENGEIKEIIGKDLLKSAKEVKNVHPILMFEGIPNRDSLKYKKLYGLEDATTMFRGTLRYKGFCDLLNEFKDLGFLNQENQPKKFSKWSELTNSLLLNRQVSQNTLNVMKWLGLFDNDIRDDIPEFNTYLDAFSYLLQERLKYAPDEYDMIILHHDFIVYNPKLQQRRSMKVSLCEYGTKEFSAMARTVGVPVAHAAWKILKKEIYEVKGVKAPIEPEIYKPILKDLSIKFT